MKLILWSSVIIIIAVLISWIIIISACKRLIDNYTEMNKRTIEFLGEQILKKK